MKWPTDSGKFSALVYADAAAGLWKIEFVGNHLIFFNNIAENI